MDSDLYVSSALMSITTSTHPPRASAGDACWPAASFRSTRLIVAISCCIGCSACGTDKNATAMLVQIDSTVVSESDSLNIGRPVDMVVSGDGAVYVSDVSQSHVIAIDRRGNIARVFGRRGHGPGEFVSPSWLSLRGDTSLYVKDGGQMIVQEFDVRTGQYVSSQPLPKLSGRIRADVSKLVVAAFRTDSQSNLTEVNENGSVSSQGSVPALGRKYPKLLGPFANQAFVRIQNTYYSINEFENAVSSWAVSSRNVRQIEFPVRARRGATAADFEMMMSDPSKAAALAYRHSIPMMLERDSRGYLVAAMYDVDRVGETFKGRFFISVLDIEGRRACVDIPLVAPDDPPARLAFVSDTLISLVQDISKNGKPVSLLRRYTIDITQCQWLRIADDRSSP